jgi:hypothetical protein
MFGNFVQAIVIVEDMMQRVKSLEGLQVLSDTHAVLTEALENYEADFAHWLEGRADSEEIKF